MRLTVQERGIYRSAAIGTYRQSLSFGPVNQLSSVKLIRGTTMVPARQQIRFGVRYRIDGTASASPIPLRLVTRYPEGGIFDPHIGQHRTSSEVAINVPLGTVNYREFHLDHVSEVVPGTWIFEFWHGDRKLGEERFCLFRVADTPVLGNVSPQEAACEDVVS